MIPFRPFHPLVLAIAQELQRRMDEQIGANPLESLKAILEERPALDVKGHATLAAQINDLMGLSCPTEDVARLALCLFLPGRRGTLFTANEMLLRDILFFPACPVAGMAEALVTNMEATWPKVIGVVKNMPLPAPVLVGVPPEAHHPAAAGPMPQNIQQFMKPDGD